MTKEEQQARATLNDHIVIHKVTDNILAMHKDGTAVYAIDVIKKPLVRCKDCKYAHMTYVGECKYCDLWKDDDNNYLELYLDGEYYCADGERKESE